MPALPLVMIRAKSSQRDTQPTKKALDREHSNQKTAERQVQPERERRARAGEGRRRGQETRVEQSSSQPVPLPALHVRPGLATRPKGGFEVGGRGGK